MPAIRRKNLEHPDELRQFNEGTGEMAGIALDSGPDPHDAATWGRAAKGGTDMRAWSGVLVAVVLIVFGYLGDQLVGAALEEARRTFSTQWAVLLDGLTRVLAVVLMIGLGWLVFSGPRDRLAGLVMLIAGGYFALVPAFSFALLVNTGIALPPFAIEAYQPTGLLPWSGAVVMVLGLVALLWPTDRLPTAMDVRREPPVTSEVSSQH